MAVLSVKEASQRYGISESKLYKLIYTAKIRAAKIEGKWVTWDSSFGHAKAK